MIKRCIGIDIGSTYISAAQMVRSGELFHIEKTFSVKMRRSTDSPVSHLKQLFSRHGFDSHANIAASLSNAKVFFRRLEKDASDPNHINEQNSSVLKQEFPVQADQLVLQFPQHGTSESSHPAVAATTKSSLREILDMLAGASVYPSLVEAAIFATHLTIKVNYPEITCGTSIIAYIDEANLTMAVVENDGIVLIRSLPLVPKESAARTADKSDLEPIADQIASVLRQEVEVTWRRLYGTGIGQETKIYIVPSCGINAGICPVLKRKLNWQVIIPDPCHTVKSSVDCAADSTICTAEGLALSLLAPEQTSGINFLQAIDLEADPMPAIKKNLATCAWLGAAIVVFLVLGLFARLFYLEKEYTSIKEGMNDIFKKTVPEETTIVDPLAQLEQRLKPLQDDYRKFDPTSAGTAKPLQLLRDISSSTPSESNITVNNILLTSKSARLSGTSPSFKSVYDWQSQLKANPKFSAVDILDVGAGTQSKSVNFTILISLDSSEKI
jgi:hypothetical protein